MLLLFKIQQEPNVFDEHLMRKLIVKQILPLIVKNVKYYVSI